MWEIKAGEIPGYFQGNESSETHEIYRQAGLGYLTLRLPETPQPGDPVALGQGQAMGTEH